MTNIDQTSTPNPNEDPIMNHQLTTSATTSARTLSALEGSIVRLEHERAQATPAAVTPERVPMRGIRGVPDGFHARDEKLDEFHLHQLARALRARGDLDPVLVLPVGEEFVLLDGRHRLEVYRRDRRDSIPVELFNGSTREAILEAIARNARTTLPMTNAERQNCAWRLNLAGYSIREIMAAAGIGRGQVSNQRTVIRMLGDSGPSHATWREALQASKGGIQREFSDDEIAEWQRENMEALATTLHKAIRGRRWDRMEIVAGGVAIYAGRNLLQLVTLLNEHLTEQDQEALWDLENSEF